MKNLDINNLSSTAHIYFIGIGGISMSGLAQIMLSKGFRVSGSDRSQSNLTDKLTSMGATVYFGHSADNIKDCDLVVYTAAVHNDNPEIIAAKERNIPLYSRAEFLGAIMKTFKHAAGISGTHGKTTTTSMLSYALIYSGFDPTISVGGELDIIDGNIKTSNSDYFITEACEYTNSFLNFFPTVSVITNIEADHLDFFSGIEEIKSSFRKFAELTKDKGYVIACGDDKNVRDTLKASDLDIKYYGINGDCEYYAKNITFSLGFPSFEIWHNDKKLLDITLKVPGNHNILNAVATVAVCDLWGADLSLVKKGIENFIGVKRRFEKKGEYNGAVIMDDYAHHPTEIKTTLKAAKLMKPDRLYCVFQPHTYSRTKTLWNDFLESFYDVDELIITHIYAAREKYDGVTDPDRLVEEIVKKGVKARYIEDFKDVEAVLKAEIKKGDMVFTMGAGNVVEIADSIIK